MAEVLLRRRGREVRYKPGMSKIFDPEKKFANPNAVFKTEDAIPASQPVVEVIGLTVETPREGQMQRHALPGLLAPEEPRRKIHQTHVRCKFRPRKKK